jgi:hypothetical protein
MMRIRSLVLAVALAASPSIASAVPVFQPGEFSVGAEFAPSELFAGDFVAAESDRNATPSTGFNLRYSFDNRIALIGTLGLSYVTIADDRDDPDLRYSLGIGGQFNLVQSSRAAFFFRGGLQFIPRFDFEPQDVDQELGLRLWAGPGVEARVAEPLSIQFYTAMLDLQLGGDTRLDFEIVPSIAMFLYF